MFTITVLTLREAWRRRIVWIAFLMGLVFLGIFWLGLRDIYNDIETMRLPANQAQMILGLSLSAGLYVVNFLIVMMAVLMSVTAVSGEIDSHTIDTLVTKPMHRWEIVLGKWIGYAIILLGYILFMVGGILLIVYWMSGYIAQNILAGLAIIWLEGLTILSVTILGGTRLSTLANGVLAFMLYGIGFIGGWVEQIGSLLQNETAVDIGIVTSLIMPTEALWRKALALFQSNSLNMPIAGPFSVGAEPSTQMVVYAIGFTLTLLLLALFSFSNRDL